MALNPMQLLGLKNDLEKFKNNHPRFIQFIQTAAGEGMREGTVLECKVVTPEGREMQTNIRVTQTDLELFEKLKAMQ